ncbi:MAG: glycosyltransferase [Mogibacterium sp.]|nr:glycosyltransferase [Mogibacterium sp.]
MLISFVIPCYYSKNVIRREVEDVMKEFDLREGYECEFILVNDGSTDGTYDVIRAMSEEYPNVKGINFIRGFGQHNAQICGMRYAKGDYVMGIDDDMQNHPSQVFKLIEKIQEGYDITYGIYNNKYKNGYIKQLTSRFNNYTSGKLIGMPKEITASSFWIITQQVNQEAIKYTSYNIILDGLFYQISHNIGQVEVEHFARAEGKSGYTFSKLVKMWLRYWNYSVIPLRTAFLIGMFSSVFGLAFTIWAVIKKMVDPMLPMGWASTICLMTLLFGAVLMVLGIVGEYLGKAILILNDTPQFIIREKTFEEED